MLNSYWRNWVWSVEWITLAKGWAVTNIVMQDWITSELVTIDLKSPTINCLIRLLFVTVIDVCVYIYIYIYIYIICVCTHIYNGGDIKLSWTFSLWSIILYLNNYKKKIMRKLRTIVAILATRLLEFVECAHDVFIVRIDVHTRADFTPATMITAGPTGIRIFTWLATIYGSRQSCRTTCQWARGSYCY